MPVHLTSCAAALLLALCAAAPAEAQRPAPRPFAERGFITVAAGVQASPEDLTERILFERHAETGSIDAVYPGRAGAMAGVAAGFRVRGRVGVAVALSRATRSGEARISAEIPHPFFDDRPRSVSGEAGDISRTETAVHGQLYYDLRPRGPWRVRLFAGPSYVSVEQEIITEVEVDEVYPYDTAEFRDATTARARGSSIGANAGLEVARMFTRRAGLSGTVRYALGSVDLDAPASRTVSTDGGGLQAALGLRILF
jgi:hypothetical protein